MNDWVLVSSSRTRRRSQRSFVVTCCNLLSTAIACDSWYRSRSSLWPGQAWLTRRIPDCCLQDRNRKCHGCSKAGLEVMASQVADPRKPVEEWRRSWQTWLALVQRPVCCSALCQAETTCSVRQRSPCFCLVPDMVIRLEDRRLLKPKP